MSNPKVFAAAFIIFACLLPANGGWTKQNSGTLAWLYAVFFLDDNRGWIVGSKGTFLTTNDGGKTWAAEKKFTQDSIRDIYFRDRHSGWLLCERSAYERGGNPPSYLLETIDGGRTWQKIESFPGPERITRLIFSKGETAYAAGEAGTLYRADEDKRSWKRLPLPIRYLILGGTFTGQHRSFLVGGGSSVIYSDDGGSNWLPAIMPAGPKAKIGSVYFVDSDVGWLAGSGGKIYFTTDGGRNWKGQTTPAANDLTDIAFLDLRNGFAVGDNGFILRTTNGGTDWKAEPAVTKHRLESVFLTGARGFAVGFGGTILVNEMSGPSREERIKSANGK